MTQKEMRLKRIDRLNERLSERYESATINGTKCFLMKDGGICRLDSIGREYNALVIEYADSFELAKKNIFGEDGGLFYLDEMDEDEMFKAMIREIEGN